jgi:hypothetical protein
VYTIGFGSPDSPAIARGGVAIGYDPCCVALAPSRDGTMPQVLAVTGAAVDGIGQKGRGREDEAADGVRIIGPQGQDDPGRARPRLLRAA